jgi:hypothetical protein
MNSGLQLNEIRRTTLGNLENSRGFVMPESIFFDA